ncbi:hypothetical protein [Rhabdothermincola salaria]|uniref:RsiG family protein n=1 Tax=Rhabdothermincola salaria TaxID=2903142 RepID=UPI001E28C973|nr:hypothetical protein [Rhabdothermincola salaria]MCD9625362.1 hypothetical protein [Rhabdothermincola salaria]
MSGTDDTPTPDGDSALELDGIGAEDLPALSLVELRQRRDAAVGTETGLSYLRRLVQGPLDLVRGELESRAGGERRDLAGLVEGLGEVLSESGRGTAGGRIPMALEPSEIDPELAAELQRVTRGGTRTAEVAAAADDELVAFAAELDTLERQVSARRRRLHRTIDVLNGELARRYRSGEATVESALSSPAE